MKDVSLKLRRAIRARVPGEPGGCRSVLGLLVRDVDDGDGSGVRREIIGVTAHQPTLDHLSLGTGPNLEDMAIADANVHDVLGLVRELDRLLGVLRNVLLYERIGPIYLNHVYPYLRVDG